MQTTPSLSVMSVGSGPAGCGPIRLANSQIIQSTLQSAEYSFWTSSPDAPKFPRARCHSHIRSAATLCLITLPSILVPITQWWSSQGFQPSPPPPGPAHRCPHHRGAGGCPVPVAAVPAPAVLRGRGARGGPQAGGPRTSTVPRFPAFPAAPAALPVLPAHLQLPPACRVLVDLGGGGRTAAAWARVLRAERRPRGTDAVVPRVAGGLGGVPPSGSLLMCLRWICSGFAVEADAPHGQLSKFWVPRVYVGPFTWKWAIFGHPLDLRTGGRSSKALS